MSDKTGVDAVAEAVMLYRNAVVDFWRERRTHKQGDQVEVAYYGILNAAAAAISAAEQRGRDAERERVELRSHAPVFAIRSLCEYGRYVAQTGSVVYDDCDKIEKWLAECSSEAVGVPPKPTPLESIQLRWDGSLPHE